MRWVTGGTGDSVYGEATPLRQAIERAGKWYVLAVTSLTRVWLERPALLAPAAVTRGRLRRQGRLAPGAARAQTVEDVVGAAASFATGAIFSGKLVRLGYRDTEWNVDAPRGGLPRLVYAGRAASVLAVHGGGQGGAADPAWATAGAAVAGATNKSASQSLMPRASCAPRLEYRRSARART